MESKEQRIKEQRAIEARSKDLMGASGRIGTVVRYLGTKMIAHHHGDPFSPSNHINLDFYSDDVESEHEWYEVGPGTPEEIRDRIPVEYDEWLGDEPMGGGWVAERPVPSLMSETELGWLFDGLSRGMHLEIRYLTEGGELSVLHQGRMVYKEKGGDLELYVPYPDWEKQINTLYKQAKPKDRATAQANKAERTETAKKNKLAWLEYVKERWGFGE